MKGLAVSQIRNVSETRDVQEHSWRIDSTSSKLQQIEAFLAEDSFQFNQARSFVLKYMYFAVISGGR